MSGFEQLKFHFIVKFTIEYLLNTQTCASCAVEQQRAICDKNWPDDNSGKPSNRWSESRGLDGAWWLHFRLIDMQSHCRGPIGPNCIMLRQSDSLVVVGKRMGTLHHMSIPDEKSECCVSYPKADQHLFLWYTASAISFLWTTRWIWRKAGAIPSVQRAIAAF